MGIKGALVTEYGKSHGRFETLVFSLRLLGLDKKAADEEVWRSTEEGKHFKLESTTGEIKAGFGGKFNGKKLGETWGSGNARAPRAPSSPNKSSSGGSNSRYWMHNIPENRLMEATQMVSGIRSSMENAKHWVEKVNDMVKSGMLTFGEGEGILKGYGYEKFSPDMNPEEFVMKCKKIPDRRKLLDVVGEARQWGEKGQELQQKNLTHEEQTALSMLTVLCADDNWTEAEARNNNLDRVFDKMTDEQKELYLDLKAKACGLPNSGKKLDEYSDELQVALGLKEPGAYEWYKPERGGSLETYINEATGVRYGYGHLYTRKEFEEANQLFLNTMKYGHPKPTRVKFYGISAISALRGRLNISAYTPGSKPTKEMLDRLTDDEKKNLLDTVNRFKDLNAFFPEPVENIENLTFADMAKAERKMTQATTIRTQEALKPLKDYILINEKMLIGAEPSERDLAKEKKKQETEAKKQKKDQWKETRDREQQEFRNSPAAAEKQAKIDRIKQFNPQAFSADNMDRLDLERAVGQTGMFANRSRSEWFLTNASMPKQVYIDAASAYKDVVTRFPFLAGELMGFGDNYQSIGAAAGCHKVPDGRTEIMINFDYLGDIAGSNVQRKKAETDKWSVPVSDDVSAARASITHEIGHALANWLHRYSYGAFNGVKASRVMCYDNEVATLLKSRTLKALGIEATYENIKEEVSEYAAASRLNKKADQVKSGTKADEFFAECFCELMCSKKPRRVAVEFGKQLDRFIAEAGIDAMSTATNEACKPQFA